MPIAKREPTRRACTERTARKTWLCSLRSAIAISWKRDVHSHIERCLGRDAQATSPIAITTLKISRGVLFLARLFASFSRAHHRCGVLRLRGKRLDHVAACLALRAPAGTHLEYCYIVLGTARPVGHALASRRVQLQGEKEHCGQRCET